MKILFINYEYPPLGGGGGRANAQIAKRLVSQGHEVAVLTSAFKGLPKEERVDGVRVIRLPTLRAYEDKCRVYEMVCFMLTSLVYAIKWGRALSPDYVIAFFTIPSAPAAWLIKFLYRVPYVVSLRGGDVPGFMKEQLSFYHHMLKPVIRFLWRQAKAVVANSDGLKELALKTDPKLAISVIPNGIDLSLFGQNVLTTSSKNSKQTVRLLSVGRLSPQKGLEFLLQAMALLKDKTFFKLELGIVGDGPSRAELEALTKKLQLGEQVQFLGWKVQHELAFFYKQADFFILPSLYEGMPNVVLEAMAMSLPVIATRVEGSSDLVIDGVTGYLVEPRDPFGLSQKIEALASNPSLRHGMGAEAKKQVCRYDWNDVALSYVELLQPQKTFTLLP